MTSPKLPVAPEIQSYRYLQRWRKGSAVALPSAHDGRLDGSLPGGAALRLSQLRAVLNAYDEFDCFDSPRFFQPEGGQHEYDFQQMLQIRSGDFSRSGSAASAGSRTRA
eukprot:2150056-Prymnesium_polylepis.2